MSSFLKATLPALMLLGAASADDSNVVIRLDTSNLVYFSNWTVASAFLPLSQVVDQQYNYLASTYNLQSTTTTMAWASNAVEKMIVKLCNTTDPAVCDATTSLIPNTFICDDDNTTVSIPPCGSSQTITIPDFRANPQFTFPTGLTYLKLSIKAYDSFDNTTQTQMTGLYTSYILGINNIGGTQAPTTPVATTSVPTTTNSPTSTAAPTSTASPSSSSAPTSGTSTPSTSVPTSTSAATTTNTPITSLPTVADNTQAPTSKAATTATPTTAKPTTAIKANSANGVAPIVFTVLGLAAASLAVIAQ